jgi:hypothetical protein
MGFKPDTKLFGISFEVLIGSICFVRNKYYLTLSALKCVLRGR